MTEVVQPCNLCIEHDNTAQYYHTCTGWVVVPSDSQDPEANTLKMWERRLREFTKKRYTSSNYASMITDAEGGSATPTFDDHYHS